MKKNKIKQKKNEKNKIKQKYVFQNLYNRGYLLIWIHRIILYCSSNARLG